MLTDAQKKAMLADGHSQEYIDVIDRKSSGFPQQVDTPDQTVLTPPMVKSGAGDSSAGGSFGRSMLTSAAPALTGGAAFSAMAGPITPWAIAAAPETFGISMLAPLAAGGLAAWKAGSLTRDAENALMTDKFKQQLAVDQQLHPVATTLGGVATMPLGGLNPNAPNAIRALGSLAKLPAGLPLAAPEMQNLMNVGMGAVMNPAMEAGGRLLEGQPMPTVGELGSSAALGALFNKPNRIGVAMGMHPTPVIARDATSVPDATIQDITPPMVQGNAPMAVPSATGVASANPLVRQFDSVNPMAGMAGDQRLLRAVADAAPALDNIPKADVVQSITDKSSTGETPEEKLKVVQALVERANKQLGLEQVPGETQITAGRPEQAVAAPEKSHPANTKVELDNQINEASKLLETPGLPISTKIAAQEQLNALRAKAGSIDILPKTEPQAEPLIKPVESSPASQAQNRGGVATPPNNGESSTTTGFFNSKVPAESSVEKAQNGSSLYQKKENTYKAPVYKNEELYTLSKELNKSKVYLASEHPNESQVLYKGKLTDISSLPIELANKVDRFKRLLAKGDVPVTTTKATTDRPFIKAESLNDPQKQARLVSLAAQHGVTLAKDSSVDPRMAGEIFRKGATDTVARLHPDNAGLDTPHHEITHALIEYMRNSNDKSLQKMVAKGEELFGGNEPFTQEAGVKALERFSQEKGYKSKLREWYGDFKSFWKYRLGGASKEDLARIMSYYEVHDVGTKERLGGEKFGGVGITPKNQPTGDEEPERVHKPAIKLKDGRVITSNTNHGEAYSRAQSEYKVDNASIFSSTDGFTTTKGRFVSREEAAKIARKEGQMNEKAVRLHDSGATSKLDSTDLEEGTKNQPASNVVSDDNSSYQALIKKFKEATTPEEKFKISQEIEDVKSRNNGMPPGKVRGETVPRNQDKNKAITDSPEFKRWFGESKVVDKEGKPLVVYHGTAHNFLGSKKAVFGKGNSGYKAPDRKLGFFFTPNEEYAKVYSEMSHGQSTNEEPLDPLAVHLSLKNPKEVSFEEWNKIKDWGRLPTQQYKNPAEVEKAFAQLKREAVEQGHDGFWIGKDRPDSEIIAFHPEQIKSAIGNKGTFDPSNPDIRYQPKDNVVKDEPKAVGDSITYENKTTRDADGSLETPYGDIKKFYRDNGKWPTNAQLGRMGYTEEQINALKDTSFKSIKRYASNSKRILERIKEEGSKYANPDTIPVFSSTHDSPADNYAYMVRDYIMQRMHENMYARKGFSDINVEHVPVVESEGQMKDVNGYYRSSDGKVVSLPESNATAMHEMLHKNFDDIIKELPDEALKMLFAKARATHDYTLDESLANLADRLKQTSDLYSHHVDNYYRYRFNNKNYHAALDILDEGLAQLATTKNLALERSARNALTKVFGDSLGTFVTRFRPYGENTSKPDTFVPGYDKETESYYQPAHKVITGLFKPEIQKIKDEYGPAGKTVGDAFTRFGETFTDLKGKLTNAVVGSLRKHINFLNPTELFTQNNEKFNRVVKYMDDKSDGITPKTVLSSEEKQIEAIVRKSMQDTVAEKNSRPGLRTTVPDPNYFPHVVSRKALDTLLNRPHSGEAMRLINDFMNYQQKTLGKTQAEAIENLKVFKAGYKSSDKNLAAKFGPIDDAAGVGIPQSWRETNLIDRISRFTNRYARRLAYHDTIETHPDVVSALEDPTNGIGESDTVKGVMDEIAGKKEYQETNRNAVAGVIRAGMMGPLTGAKDFTSNLVLGLQHQDKAQIVPAKVYALTNMMKSLKESFDAGVNRHNIGSFEFGDGGIDNLSNILRSSRDVINAVQGRNILEQVTRATAFGEGKFLAMDNLWKAKAGGLSAQGEKFLNDFASQYDWKSYRSKGEFPPEILQKIAARYTESVQGTYDSRGLPAIAQRGSFAPVMSLARWNIEKMNNFFKYNVDPAMKGNYTPLLMSTLGMLVGGAAVSKLVELATGRKDKAPTINEIAESKDKLPGVAYKLAALSSLSGYAGILGDLFKGAMDVEFKNQPTSYNNPLISGITDAMDIGGDLYEAIKEGNLDLTADVLDRVLESYFQAYRLAAAHLSESKQHQISDANKNRDLKMFKNLNDLPVGTPSKDRPNPFIDRETKQFKKTEDLQEAQQLLPTIVKQMWSQSGGDMDRFKRDLNGLKQNPLGFVPSPESSPNDAIRYIDFVRRTQGEVAARNLITEYYRRNTINQAKSSLVPSL